MGAAISLEQIRIDSPREMPWDEMHGDDHRRFCAKCNLQVTNLSALSSDAAEKLVGERTHRICVAYVPTTAGTPITLDYEKRKRRFTWKLTVMVGVLGASAAAWAQAVIFRSKPLPTPPALGIVAGGLRAPPPTLLRGAIASPATSDPRINQKSDPTTASSSGAARTDP